MNTDTSEKGLESLIEESLLQESGYEKGNPTDYDRALCVDRAKLFAFLLETQPAIHARVIASDLETDKFLKRLFDQVRDRGIVDVLRKGIKHGADTIRFYYPNPASDANAKSVANWYKNIFSLTRQLRYSEDNKALALDMGLFLNGIPLATFELKNQLTKQNVQHAIKQYKEDRDPKEPLFAFARCLVHFAVDDNLVYMTTHLRGWQTSFLPFNLGNDGDAGNPVNPNGLKTDYLWKRILTKASLAGIIEKYAQVVEEKDDEGKTKKKLLFPRYHQLEVVRLLLADAAQNGAGRRYLIQHSAGSGKSNSLSWLAHQLVELTDEANKNVFDTVIIVTDRRNLDKQIRDNVKQFAHVAGVVEAITEGSKQLREALEGGKKIITTTVQKFPFIVDEMGDLPGKKFALLIDEAHSSQSGETAAKMNAALAETKGTYQTNNSDETETDEDKINRIIESRKMLKNASYFAFTATPKNKTLETFGVQGEDGKFRAFHLYSMRQAINEKFILDVLQNYTTYFSFYRLAAKIEEDPQFDKTRAQKKMRKYVETHPHSIQQKANVMVAHFHDEVQKKIGGRAKAMIVTGSIESAIKYKHAVDAALKELRSPFKAIVAFTGTKKLDGLDYDEASMNRFSSNEIPDTFKKSEYRFLIVAEKFQTGFDQPLLHTMYVDKTLSDVQAVQTLSRLNRCYPGKEDTFVLDFVNKADDICQAFDPYYKATLLSEATDVNRLNDLQDQLDNFQVYSATEVRTFMVRFLAGASRSELDPLLDHATEVYTNTLSDDQRIEFKGAAKSFVRTYAFLAAILPFANEYWESLHTYLRLLITKLPSPLDEDLAKEVLDSIDLESYRLERNASFPIELQGNVELDPIPAEPGGAPPDPELDNLSAIIATFNDRFGTDDWTEGDHVHRFLFHDLPESVHSNEEYQNAKNNDEQTAKIVHDKVLENKFQDFMVEYTDVYRMFSERPEFKQWLSATLFALDAKRTSVVPA
jgi:type I restriction enzyme, R subunit